VIRSRSWLPWRRRARPGSRQTLPAVDVATSNELAKFRQADHLPDIRSLALILPDGRSRAIPTPHGAVVISQTCDVVQPNRRSIHLAPLSYLQDSQAREARDGRRPQYVHLPEIGDKAFVDLEVIATVARADLRGQQRTAGVLRDQDIRRFGLAVGRKFSRFAFPDEVAAFLRPLTEVAQSKATKASSAEGRIFAKVVEWRVEAENGWQSGPYELVLTSIVAPGELPTFPNDELPNLPEHLNIWLYGPDGRRVPTSGQIAERLDRETDRASRYFLWMALGEAWAARCRPNPTTLRDAEQAVISIRGEVVPADEYSLMRVRRSEILDLDHLSPPSPL
jgi:hypothetical protein